METSAFLIGTARNKRYNRSCGEVSMTFKEQKRIQYLRPFMVVIAAIIMSLNIKIMVRNGGLYPGGATGLTILTQAILQKFFNIEISYTFVNVFWNALPVYIGFKYIGKNLHCFLCL